MARLVKWIAFLVIVVAPAIFWIVSYFVDLSFVPERLQRVNWLGVLPGASALLWHVVKRLREESLLRHGLQYGTAQSQRLDITPTRWDTAPKSGPIYLLHWEDTSFWSEVEMPMLFGSNVAAKLFQAAAKKATYTQGSVIPHCRDSAVLIAFRNAVSKLTSSLRGQSGKKRRMVIVPACEDQARVVRTRFFEIPPAMLLLFLKLESDPSLFSIMATRRPEQWYRVIAMELIARQVVGGCTGAPALGGAIDDHFYAVRNVPHEGGAIDWWDPKWDFDPCVPYTAEELDEKRRALIIALSRLAVDAAPEPTSRCHLVTEEPAFAKRRALELTAAERLSKAKHT